MPCRELKEVKIWVTTVTIDLLLKNGIYPISLISADKLAYYWLNKHVNDYVLEKAKHFFDKTFEPNDEQRKEAYLAIEQAYKNK